MRAFVPNPFFEEELARSLGLQVVVHGLTEDTADEVRATGPRDEGNYIEGIETDVGIEDGRATGRVIANDMASGLIEFGTVNNPPFAPLRRAAEKVVGNVTDDGR